MYFFFNIKFQTNLKKNSCWDNLTDNLDAVRMKRKAGNPCISRKWRGRVMVTEDRKESKEIWMAYTETEALGIASSQPFGKGHKLNGRSLFYLYISKAIHMANMYLHFCINLHIFHSIFTIPFQLPEFDNEFTKRNFQWQEKIDLQLPLRSQI